MPGSPRSRADDSRSVGPNTGGGTLRWTYTLTAAQGGTDVTLGYQVLDPVPVMLHVVLRVFFGCRDLEADLHVNLETSLARIAELVEGRQVATQGRAAR